MLTAFDDFPLHQTGQPIAHTASGDPNHYDRYFFNGYDAAGSLYFAAAMGLYPNRYVVDAAFSVVVLGADGIRRQSSVFASARAPKDRRHATTVGPVAVLVEEPLRRLRITVDAPEQGLRAEVTFVHRTAALEEPHFLWRRGTHLIFDYTRLTQWGTWSGWIEVDGVRHAVDATQVMGTRDRSWGVRPVGERPPGSPASFDQFYWLWAPVNFDDGCLHFDVNEYADGHAWHGSGFVVPLGDGEPEQAVRAEYDLRWQPGTRHADAFELRLHRSGGAVTTARFEPIFHFPMLGIGYGHPEWRHGGDKGERAVGGQRWELPLADALAPQHVHVQTLCRVTRHDGAVGTGILETLAIGPHEPTALTGMLDGAPG